MSFGTRGKRGDDRAVRGYDKIGAIGASVEDASSDPARGDKGSDAVAAAVAVERGNATRDTDLEKPGSTVRDRSQRGSIEP